MQYLLNSVAADDARFSDIQERFVFVGQGSPDPVDVEDWRMRGITPIIYDSKNKHEALGHTLKKWSELSPINGRPAAIKKLLKRMAAKPFDDAEEWERELFKHFFRRANFAEAKKMTSLMSEMRAETGWLDAILTSVKFWEDTNAR